VAKKKKRRRPPTRPAQGPEQGSARAVRKEEARKEREARIRRARRRVLLRRLTKVGIVVVLATLIAGFIYWRGGESRRLREQAALGAERLGCGQAQDLPDEGREHLAAGEQPPDYGTTPATSGKHSGSTLPPDPAVYDQPFDTTIESQAVHNLEHGYVIMYYRQDGDAAVPQPTVDALADLANGEDQVLLAPYPDLPQGESLAFAAWTHLQTCPPVTPENTDDVVAVARGFIDEFRDHSDAPEAASP
jgi:Protein of unknown function (DUF3105)